MATYETCVQHAGAIEEGRLNSGNVQNRGENRHRKGNAANETCCNHTQLPKRLHLQGQKRRPLGGLRGVLQGDQDFRIALDP